MIYGCVAVTGINLYPRMTRMTRIAPLAHNIRIISPPGGHPRHLRHPRAKKLFRLRHKPLNHHLEGSHFPQNESYCMKYIKKTDLPLPKNEVFDAIAPHRHEETLHYEKK